MPVISNNRYAMALTRFIWWMTWTDMTRTLHMRTYLKLSHSHNMPKPSAFKGDQWNSMNKWRLSPKEFCSALQSQPMKPKVYPFSNKRHPYLCLSLKCWLRSCPIAAQPQCPPSTGENGWHLTHRWSASVFSGMLHGFTHEPWGPGDPIWGPASKQSDQGDQESAREGQECGRNMGWKTHAQLVQYFWCISRKTKHERESKPWCLAVSMPEKLWTGSFGVIWPLLGCLVLTQPPCGV